MSETTTTVLTPPSPPPTPEPAPSEPTWDLDSKQPRCPMPSCRKFVKEQRSWTDQRRPGFYCECGWTAPLKNPLPVINDLMTRMPASLLDLVRSAPQNAAVRARINSSYLLPVPKCCQTFEDIAAWFNECVPGHVMPSDASEPEPIWTPPAPPRDGGPGTAFAVRFSVTDREHGRCRYVSDRSWRGARTIDLESVRSAVEQALENEVACDPEGMEQVLRNIVSDELDQNYPDMQTDETDYDDYDSNDINDTQTHFENLPQQARALRAFVANYLPDLWQEWRGQ